MKNGSKASKSRLNALVTLLVMLAALWFFSSRSKDDGPVVVEPKRAKVSPPQQAPFQPAKGSTTASSSGSAPAANVPQIPAAIPPGHAVVTQESGLVELPPDIQQQLNAPPPELPEDLKRQLAAPPPELPEDLKRQLNAPPPEMPDDIKRALQIPPRMVTIEEVNNPDGARKSPPPPKE